MKNSIMKSYSIKLRFIYVNQKQSANQIGKRPSYAWRSIMAAKSVVEEGIRWSIGNG